MSDFVRGFSMALNYHVGQDVRIDEFSRIKLPLQMTIGNHVAIDWGFYCTTQLFVGDYVHVAPYVTVIGGADGKFKMMNFCTIAAGSRIIVRGDEHLGAGLVSPVIPKVYRDNVIGREIIMEDFSALGTNSILMPNVRLAQGVVIGANSLVTKPIDEPWTVWAGSPVRKLKDRPKEKMIENARKLGYDY